VTKRFMHLAERRPEFCKLRKLEQPETHHPRSSRRVGRQEPAARSWVVGLRLFKLPQLAELRSALR